jgi:acetolactate synthase-1/2/3 large subunit
MAVASTGKAMSLMQLTGGQALAQQLALEGITHVFGIPGVQLDWGVDGLRQIADRIQYVVPRHEQATSYMADGYARTTGKIGTCMVVPGPGLLNAMSGLSTAYACSSPVLAIVGDIPSSAVGKNLGLLHEVRNQSGILSTVTKWQSYARSPGEIPGIVREAFKKLRSDRHQPVGLEIPQDVLRAVAAVELIPPERGFDGRLSPRQGDIDAAAELLGRSRFPVIYVGGGVLAAGASRALQALAEKLGAPVVMGENGRGAISDRHPLALNALGGRAIFPHADVALIVGSRFIDTAAGRPSWPSDRAKYIYLNVEAAAWDPPRHANVSIQADALLWLEALAGAVSRRVGPSHADLDRVRAWALQQIQEVEPQLSWLQALRSALPDDGILVNELTQVGYLARIAYPVYLPGTFINPGYQGTLGYGFPTALGAAVGNPGRRVISIVGDGGFGWNMQELATARRYDLNIAVVVFNDGHFGNVRRMQQDQFAHPYGDELTNPDFGKLADAFGIAYARVDVPSDLERVLSSSNRAPILIEASVGAMPSPWHLMRLEVPPFAKGGSAPANPLGEVRAG